VPLLPVQNHNSMMRSPHTGILTVMVVSRFGLASSTKKQPSCEMRWPHSIHS
jgi:hypothetical protein